jgi:hypothetical protein
MRMTPADSLDPPFLWLGDTGYAIQGDQFLLADRSGPSRRIPIPFDRLCPGWREIMDSAWRSSSGRPSDHIGSPWLLALNPHDGNLVGSCLIHPAIVLCADRKGALLWAAFIGPNCCNFPCLFPRPDRILHCSSCGQCVTSLDRDGKTVGRLLLQSDDLPIDFISDGKEGGCVLTPDRVIRVDADARPSWRFSHDLGASESDAAKRELVRLAWSAQARTPSTPTSGKP